MRSLSALFAIWILLVATFGPIGLVNADEEQPVVSGKSICFQPGVGVVDVAEKTDNSICVVCTEDLGKVECLVENFNLPQDPQTDWDDAGGWISGYRDPSYLLYYEAFPEGEEGAWQFPGNEMLYVGLIINGVMTALHIKPVAEALKTVAKPATTAPAKLAAKNSILQFLRTGKDRIGGVFTKKVVEESTEDISDSVVKKRVGRMAGFIGRLFKKGADDVGVSMTDDMLKESTDALGRNSAGKEIAEMTYDDAAMFIDDIVENKYIITSLVNDGFTTLEAKSAVNFLKVEYGKNIGVGVEKLNLIPAAERKVVISRVWNTATTVWQNSPAARGWAMSVYDMTVGSDAADEAMVGDDESLRNLKDFADMIMKAGMVVSNPRAATKTGTGLKFAGIFAIAGASISAELADEVLMKFSPEAGVNGMALSMPFYPAQTMQLGDETHKYYVQLVKDDGVFGTSVASTSKCRLLRAWIIWHNSKIQ